MKNLVIALIVMFGFTFSVNAQTHYKQDGTPDMRYKENKATHIHSLVIHSQLIVNQAIVNRHIANRLTVSQDKLILNRLILNQHTQHRVIIRAIPTNKTGHLICVIKRINNYMVTHITDKISK